MTTYPHHGLHIARHRPQRILMVTLVLIAMGLGVYFLVAHFTGSDTKSVSDAQAVAFIQTGTGLSGLNVLNGNPNLHGTALPASVRPYAIHMYRSGPYATKVLSLLYAVGAAGVHSMSASERQAVVATAPVGLAQQVAAQVTHPEWITQYGVTVRQAVAAVVRGMLVGAAT